MNAPFRYTTSYILDKNYFTECFEASVTEDRTLQSYYKTIGFFLVGTALLLTGVNSYASLFIIGLGAIEGLSVRFKKSWWLWRQMLSKAANNEVQLTIDELGIDTQSEFVKGHISWKEVIEHKVSDNGYLIKHSGGTSYLSKKLLDTNVTEFIKSKLK
ncbi:YcxB family protein [Shewanella nanhaiensis]|uniref:YcxB family protein n=1 Tax=Shewanella nanhaiensis TaxID=2864872 RepID=A0ABS7E1B1_9GAMM|nr:YcxB family protein [Shewanella nanhaiensis]MBW8183434.1 YcxB family protein [Shewanella nanhaiensis]